MVEFNFALDLDPRMENSGPSELGAARMLGRRQFVSSLLARHRDGRKSKNHQDDHQQRLLVHQADKIRVQIRNGTIRHMVHLSEGNGIGMMTAYGGQQGNNSMLRNTI